MKKTLQLTLVLFFFGTLSVSLQAQIPTDSLVAYYPFNGNANDESGNGNDGVVNGATLTTDRFGNVNSAYSFDGVDDWINAPNSGLPDADESRTLTAWVKFNSYGNLSVMVG